MESILHLDFILSKGKNRDIKSLIFAEMLMFFSFLLMATISASIPSYVPTDSISLDCTSSIFPSGVKMSSSPGEFNHNSSVVSRIYNIGSNSFQNSKTFPCIFRKQTTYTFTVSTGPKFIRLHFQPIENPILDISKALFSVSVAGYTLLNTSKFSEHNLPVDYAIREFCINIDGQTVNLTFTPSLGISDSYAFVNKIEVVSMPSNLYIKEDFPLPLVGYPSLKNYIRNSRALEMMHQVNIGGDSIPPEEDTGMFRLWIEDTGYLISDQSSTSVIESEGAINFSSSVPAYTAPEKVYASARTVTIEGNYAKWSFPVDFGFNYLVRLHFCDISGATEGVFWVSINNRTVEDHADVIHSSHGAGIPIYKDYIVNFSRHSEGIKHLSVAIGLLDGSDDISWLAILNGVEIFKLSDLSNNLAGPYPFGTRNGHNQKFPRSSEYKDLKLLIAIWSFMGFDMVIIILCLVFLQLPYDLWPSLFVPLLSSKLECQRKTFMQKQTSETCRCFSFAEMKAATDNFSNNLLIGAGGFGKVYKGTIKGGTTPVAIKRSNPDSHQGLNEFQNEVTMLSKLRHGHLVSLIGYCMENKEMILVYDYMAHGTLCDHLYKTNQPPLPWKQRLRICIGAARGLHYLHTGANHTIIHRDVKSTNILLDENWVAKVSDFGLSKVGPNLLTQSNTHVSTVVKGSFGYLDPEYYRRQKLTEKSDVYSFGVVLFEVLCARPAVLRLLENGEDDHEKVNLAEWAIHCCQSGTLDQIIDPYLQGKIDPTCLKTYSDIARKSLVDRGCERPKMGDVLWNLEQALLQQQEKDHFQKQNTDYNVADMTYPGELPLILDGAYGQGFCLGDSDPTPGLEFSDLINPTGR